MNMASTVRHYTPAEAAALSGLALKAVHNAIDKRIVEIDAQPSPKRARRSLSIADVLHPAAKRVKADTLVIVDVEEARKQIAERVRALEAAEATVVVSRAILGGEPVFKGTRVPVRSIAAMLDEGTSEAEILDGYPALEPRHLALARIWAAAHPRRGRPKTLADRGAKVRGQTRTRLKADPGAARSRRGAA
jgi:uncharacterized protein (DUF433 family)